MLALSRRRGQILRIGDDIRITILAIDGDQVRIGFEAPDHVAIQRSPVRSCGKPAASASADDPALAGAPEEED